ncbi:MAG: hypothetical protein DRN24_03825 [Thermoplasmata archaeon]|nr:MAG: hypothetical protein DRN24_03825 [Thermoplasmata archaeon]
MYQEVVYYFIFFDANVLRYFIYLKKTDTSVNSISVVFKNCMLDVEIFLFKITVIVLYGCL